MNFVIWAVQNKKTGKIVGGSFDFVYWDRPPKDYKPSKTEKEYIKKRNDAYITKLGLNPKNYKVVPVTHYKTLKKLRKALWYRFRNPDV